jgi:oligopeptide transport system substrate-binding protein
MQCYFLRWAADYLDPQNFLSTMLRTGAPENSLGYSNPEFDRLCDAADVMQDHEKRLATYRKAEALVVNDAPWAPIYFQKDVELWNPKLRGVEDSLMGHLPHKRTYLETSGD